jgi:GNAT superfamily N-acetyltransferase
LDDAAEQGEVQLITTDRPNAGMRVVFDNAYSSGGSPGDVGYFSLPSEYGDAFENGHPTPPCTHRHFAAYIDGKCVGVGTACLNGDIAGIYSVATHRSFRRRGVGTLISAEASRWALKHAAKGIVLQTEADSPVEQMYLQLGFKRSFLGTLLTPYSE